MIDHSANTSKAFSLLAPYLKYLLLLLLLCTALRGVFFYINQQVFSSLDSQTIALAFVHGLRFDLAAISLCLAPWLLTSIPLYVFQFKKAFILFTKCYWPLLPILLIASNIGDSLYFPFTGRRSGIEVFTFAQDLKDQGFQLLIQYWLIALISVVVCFTIIHSASRFICTNRGIKRAWYTRTVLAVLIFLFAAISIRSSLQSKPLGPSHAYSWPHSSSGSLVLNSTFTLLRQDSKQLQKIDFFETDLQAKKLNKVTAKSWPTPIKDANIVFIVLESFGSEYLAQDDGTKGYAPFLNSLTQQSISFPNAYANGRRSIDALPSILAAIPPLLPKSFITSSYLGNKVSGIAAILAKENYQSQFFHGAKNGSMYLDTMSKRFGFESFVGLNEYPNKNDFDGQWGIFDEPYLQYTAKQISKLNAPFIAGVFTLSSHNPYTLPKEYTNQFPKGSLDIHQSIGYTDMALQKFFNSAQQQSWYNNTLFIITADHTSISDNKVYQTTTGRHRVPLLLFSPGGFLKPSKNHKVAQHTDIPSTVLDYLGLGEKYAEQILPFGHSLLSSKTGEAFFIESDQYVLVNEQATLITSKDFKQFQFNSDNNALKTAMLLRIKAKVQLFNNGMINNNFNKAEN
jgi:phosphoglycerol transferase MdoB-like AlkP superfamily enzyme